MVIFFKKIFKHWLPVFLWAILIFYLSNQPDLKSGLEFDFYLRKAAHVSVYFVLTYLLFRSFKAHNLTYKKAMAFSAVIAFLYAASDEWHQSFVFGREGKISDVTIDGFGVLFYFFYYRLKNLGVIGRQIG